MSEQQPTAKRQALDADRCPCLALRPREAASALGISARKLWEITADRTSGIPHCRFGKAVIYPVGLLAAWLASRVEKNSAKRG